VVEEIDEEVMEEENREHKKRRLNTETRSAGELP
jgi:hypothetical protein